MKFRENFSCHTLSMASLSKPMTFRFPAAGAGSESAEPDCADGPLPIPEGPSVLPEEESDTTDFLTSVCPHLPVVSYTESRKYSLLARDDCLSAEQQVARDKNAAHFWSRFVCSIKGTPFVFGYSNCYLDHSMGQNATIATFYELGGEMLYPIINRLFRGLSPAVVLQCVSLLSLYGPPEHHDNVIIPHTVQAARLFVELSPLLQNKLLSFRLKLVPVSSEDTSYTCLVGGTSILAENDHLHSVKWFKRDPSPHSFIQWILEQPPCTVVLQESEATITFPYGATV